ncbi:MAG: glycerophosphodiester phosphodiesterase family protein [Ruthenibacterium lactatiformans]
MAVFLWVLAVCIVLLWLFLRPGRYGEAQKQLVYGVNHAHRGLHTKDKTVPENSLPAFRAAAEAGYGVELDIQLSRTGRSWCSDDTLDRVRRARPVDEFTFEGCADASVRHTGDDPC